MHDLINPPYETWFRYLRRHLPALLITGLLSVSLAVLYLFLAAGQIGPECWPGLSEDMLSTAVAGAQHHCEGAFFPYLCCFFFLLYPLVQWRPRTFKDWLLLLLGGTAGVLLMGIGRANPAYTILFASDNGSMPVFIQTLLPVLCACLFCRGRQLALWCRKKNLDQHPWIYPLFGCLGISLISMCLLETQIGTPLQLQTSLWPVNVLYWVLLFLLVYGCTGHLRIAASINLLASWFIGAANVQLQHWRGDYIMPGDLSALGTGGRVASHYQITLTAPVLLTAAICLTGLILLWARKWTRPRPRFTRPVRAVIAVGTVVLLSTYTYLSFRTTQLYGSIPEITFDNIEAIDQYGYLCQFIANMRATQNVTIDTYDIDHIDKTLTQYSVTEQSQPDQEPTIIVIQNESFTDLTQWAPIETDKPITPYLDSLNDKIAAGTVRSSIRCGPTTVTEFEFITQASYRFMPSNSNPYTMYIHERTQSLADLLHAQPVPYQTIFFHPYYASGYDRPNVYKYFGFDQLVFYDTWNEKQTLRDLVTDRQNYLDVIDLYESAKETSPNQPIFLFNVTIQNHGMYIENAPVWDDPVQITNLDAKNELSMYINLIHESDRALQTLIDYFSACDEPVIILFYGDHSPTFSDTTLQQLADLGGKNLDDLYEQEYTIPYFIWANYETDFDLPDTPVSFCMLASLLLGQTDLIQSDFTRYQLDLLQTYPVISAHEVWKGNETADTSVLQIEQDLTTYHMIQYNMLFDPEQKLNDHFLP